MNNFFFDFHNNENNEFNKYKKILYKITNIVFKKLQIINNNFIIELNFVNNDKIREINFKYRKINKITDVISFSFFKKKEINKFKNIKSKYLQILGEINIAIDKAKKQALKKHNALWYELSFLYTHGLLHLFGFDHIKKKDGIIMNNEQKKIFIEVKKMKKTEVELIDEAIIAMKRAYVPYSNFAVGAALLCKDGTIFRGNNIENASYGLSMCAERNTIFKAYTEGKNKNDIIALAVVADSDRPVSPCGACRQVMSELLKNDTKIYLANLKGEKIITTPEKLLPYSFTTKDLKK